jgi:hypothetical protein
MSALLRAVAILLVETASWCALVAAVATLVAVPLSFAVDTGRDRRTTVVHAAIGAALAVGLAARIGLPHLWSLGLEARRVTIVWALAGATLTVLVEAAIARRTPAA